MKNIYTYLARESIRNYLERGKIIPTPIDLPAELLNKKAGVFVSLHRKDDHALRGCIGTFIPTKKNIAREIIDNALEAAFHDPRFYPVRPEELDQLKISVDILSAMKKIKTRNELDPNKYGILVANKFGRRGLLLPDIENVEIVDQQINIACKKAGIDSQKEKIDIYKFTVKRYLE